MIISELIEKLNELKDIHGDIEVCIEIMNIDNVYCSGELFSGLQDIKEVLFLDIYGKNILKKGIQTNKIILITNFI